MNYLKNNPRKCITVAAYLAAAAICGPILHVSGVVMILTLALLTLALIIIFLPATLAVAGNYLYATGSAERAVPILKKAIDKNTPSPAAHVNYAIYLVRGGKGEDALYYLDKASKLKPDIMTQKNIELTKASCFWTIGKVDDAVNILEAMREKFEYVNAHVLTTLGYMHFLQGNLEKAEDITRQAIEDSPETGSAWDNLGQISFKRGDFESAKAHFEKAVEYKADLPDSHYYLGLLAERENSLFEARDCYLRASSCNISALNTVTRQQIDDRLRAIKEALDAQDAGEEAESPSDEEEPS
ncbi:MAG: tetratricopeptide repeat protein [Clostridiales bacterium]|nr:tetratricopeptide repeat protein [Clostridiales bacterium]